MDPFNPATRKYVFNQLKQNYMRYGIKTFWLYEAEPERHTQDINIRYKATLAHTANESYNVHAGSIMTAQTIKWAWRGREQSSK